MKRLKEIIYGILLIYIFGYHFFPYTQIDPETRPFLNSFQVKMWDKCTPKQTNYTWQISIQIIDKPRLTWFSKEIIGICHPRLFGFDISLRKDYWDAVNDTGKKQLLYHELLHCYLSMEHKSGTIMDEYTIPFGDVEIEVQLDSLLSEACGH